VSTRVVHCKKEKADVYIGRPGPFANPFRIRKGQNRLAAVERFRLWVLDQPDVLFLAKKRLPGKSLGCWCAPAPCHGDVLRELVDSPDSIPEHPVLVFGSSPNGTQGDLTARYAVAALGGRAGASEGISGNSYAVPVKGDRGQPLAPAAIIDGLRRFFAFSSGEGAHLDYRLSRVGCETCPESEPAIRDFCLDNAGGNVELPGVWVKEARSGMTPRVIVAGSRGFDDRPRLDRAIDQVQAKLGRFEIVSGGATGADSLGEDCAVDRRLPLRRFPADWEGLNKAAGMYRNAMMGWYGTHLLAFHKDGSPGTGQMIALASAGGLTVGAIRV